jgi:hypothetical protein
MGVLTATAGQTVMLGKAKLVQVFMAMLMGQVLVRILWHCLSAMVGSEVYITALVQGKAASEAEAEAAGEVVAQVVATTAVAQDQTAWLTPQAVVDHTSPQAIHPYSTIPPFIPHYVRSVGIMALS